MTEFDYARQCIVAIGLKDEPTRDDIDGLVDAVLDLIGKLEVAERSMREATATLYRQAASIHNLQTRRETIHAN